MVRGDARADGGAPPTLGGALESPASSTERFTRCKYSSLAARSVSIATTSSYGEAVVATDVGGDGGARLRRGVATGVDGFETGEAAASRTVGTATAAALAAACTPNETPRKGRGEAATGGALEMNCTAGDSSLGCRTEIMRGDALAGD